LCRLLASLIEALSKLFVSAGWSTEVFLLSIVIKYLKKLELAWNSIRKSTFFWILDWMDDWISNQIQLQKSRKVGFSIHVQCQKSKKSKKVRFLDFRWISIGKVFALDWIFLVQSFNNPLKIQQKSKNPTFLDFWSWIRLDVQSSIQSKIQKKVDFLILVWK
jgi:hypothetical protein